MRNAARGLLASLFLSAPIAPVWAGECAGCIAFDLSRPPTRAQLENVRSQLSATHSIFVLSALEGALSSLAETGTLAEVIEIAIKRRSASDSSVQEIKSRRFAIRASDLTLVRSPQFEIEQIAHDGERSGVGFNGAVFRFSLSHNQLKALPLD